MYFIVVYERTPPVFSILAIVHGDVELAELEAVVAAVEEIRVVGDSQLLA